MAKLDAQHGHSVFRRWADSACSAGEHLPRSSLSAQTARGEVGTSCESQIPFRGKKGLLRLVGIALNAGLWEGNVTWSKWGFPQAQEGPPGRKGVRADHSAQEAVHHSEFLPARALPHEDGGALTAIGAEWWAGRVPGETLGRSIRVGVREAELSSDFTAT